MDDGRPFLQAALNGARNHPQAPRTPRELADESAAAVGAGAVSVHLHPYDESGRETLEAGPCARAVRAVRKACPDITISLSTSAEIEPDARRRLAAIAAWIELPDLVSVNQGEQGADELMSHIISRGIGIEAGLLCLEDATAFVRSPHASRCERVLVEPLDADPRRAVAHAEAMMGVLRDAGVTVEQVHHGDGIASWAVNRNALLRGHGIRTGLEDTPVLPDGRRARGNRDLVAAAAEMVRTYWKGQSSS